MEQVLTTVAPIVATPQAMPQQLAKDSSEQPADVVQQSNKDSYPLIALSQLNNQSLSSFNLPTSNNQSQEALFSYTFLNQTLNRLAQPTNTSNDTSDEIVTMQNITNPNSSILWLKMTEKSGYLKNTPTKPVFNRSGDMNGEDSSANEPAEGQVLSSSSLILKRRERRRAKRSHKKA